jgi:oligopeptide transport system substrate-binding protein
LTLSVLILFLAACGGIEASSDLPTSTTEEATSGIQAVVTRIAERIAFVTPTPNSAAVTPATHDPIELDLSLAGTLPDLDPASAELDTQFDLAQNLFVGLTNFNPDSNSVEPELALSWEVSPDGHTWTFELRDDVYWVKPNQPPPGSTDLWTVDPVRPVVAADVAYAIYRLCDREVESSTTFSLFLIEGCEELYRNPEPAENIETIAGIRVIDDTTLEIKLREPAAYFLTLTSMPLFQPVPRELVSELGSEWQTSAGREGAGWQVLENLVTSGPYFPVPLDSTSQSLVLHRNPLWPVTKSGNADVINIYFMEDEADAFGLWQERTLDIAPLPANEREAFLRRNPNQVQMIPEPVLFYIGFNFGSAVFGEPEVRRAFSAAIDREELIEEIYGGQGQAMRHVTVPGIVAALPVGEVGVGYSPDYARQQMSASTFRSCRLMPPVTMLVSSADLSMRQAELIRDMWVEELECLKENINIQQVQFGELLAYTRPDATNRPDLWELAWAPIFPDAHNFLNDLLHCTNSENRQNRPCDETDSLQMRAGSVTNAEDRIALYRQIEGQYFGENGQFPIAPLYIRTRFIVTHDWIDVFKPVTFGGQQWDRIVLDPVLKNLERSRS